MKFCQHSALRRLLPLPPALPPLMSGSAAGQLGSPASPQDPPEDDEPDFVHSYVEDFTIERYGPRVRLLVHSDELQRTLRAAGLRCAELQSSDRCCVIRFGDSMVPSDLQHSCYRVAACA